MEEGSESGTNELSFRSRSGDTAEIRNVPASIVQAIYHEVTGKTETLSYLSNKAYLINYSDLDEFYHKLRQQLEQHHLIGPTITVRVTYSGHKEDVFSSWERFSHISTGRVEPIQQISLTAEFLIALPLVQDIRQDRAYQRYKLELVIVSKTAMDHDDKYPFSFRVIPWSTPSIFCKIEYIDFVVANNLRMFVDEWAKTLTIIPYKWHFPKLQALGYRVAGYFETIGRISALPASYLMIKANWPATASFYGPLPWVVTALGFILFFGLLFRTFGYLVESNIEKTMELSCICINKGDQKFLDTRMKKNRSSILRAAIWAAATVATIAVNVFSNYIYDLVK